MIQFFFVFLLLIIGQVVRIDMGMGVTLLPLDGGIFIFNLLNIKIFFNSFYQFKKSKLFLILVCWFVFAFLYLIFFVDFIPFNQKIFSSMYLFRLVEYLLFFYISKIKFQTDKSLALSVQKLIIAYPVLIAVLGFIQLILYPDLRNLVYLGWDPHFGRLFSVILDPNFTGLILVFGALIIFYRIFTNKKPDYRMIFSLIIILPALILTYSRSSYLSLFMGLTFLAVYLRKKTVLIFIVLLFILFIFLIPKPQGEGGKLERISTIDARLNNFAGNFELFKQRPIFGYGYNTLKYLNSSKKNIADANFIINHASGGIDNSYLYIAVTMGSIGLVIFLYLILTVLLQGNIIIKSLTISLIVHAVFQNSWFFPQIFIYYLLTLAVFLKKKIKGNS